MGYVGAPEHGVRLEVCRSDVATPGPVATYVGHAHFATFSIGLTCSVSLEEARVTLSDGGELTAREAEALSAWASALVRAATKSELIKNEPLPRKIVRWRALAPNTANQ